MKLDLTDAIETATDAVRDDLLKIPAELRPLITGMLSKSLMAAAPEVAAQALRSGANTLRSNAGSSSTAVRSATHRADAGTLMRLAEEIQPHRN